MINKWKYAIKKVCKDDPSLIENYDKAINDTTQIWILHHRDEVRYLPSGMIAFRSKKELVENGRYYNCPANELIFLTRTEHATLHYSANEEYKKKLSKALFGHVVNKETREKISAAKIGSQLSEETKNKISLAYKGKNPWNKGKKGLQTAWNKGMSGTDYTSHYPNGVKNSNRAKEG